MRRLRWAFLSIARFFGLYDDGVTEIENRRAMAASAVHGWTEEQKRKITKP